MIGDIYKPAFDERSLSSASPNEEDAVTNRDRPAKRGIRGRVVTPDPGSRSGAGFDPGSRRPGFLLSQE